jgi:RNA polymerase sigma factor (sigma-70 family)
MALSDQEWKDAYHFAQLKAKFFGAKNELVEDMAATAMEKLVKQDPKPDNIEAWLTTVVRNQMIDQNRKKHPDGGSWHVFNSHIGDFVDNLSRFLKNPKSIGSDIAKNMDDKQKIRGFLGGLNQNEIQLMELFMKDTGNEEIAQIMGYGSAKIAATRIQQVLKKIRKIHSIDF